MLNKQEKFTIYKNDEIQNYYDEHIYFLKYDGIIRNVILQYKFKDKSYLYKTITNYMIKNKNFCRFLKSYDIMVPVPISKKRNKDRGYNQSLLIARDLAKRLDLKLENRSLIKNKNIIEQSKLGKQEREKNIEGVYTLINGTRLENKKILLVDDIYTTGSTVNECCKTIRNNVNIKQIGVLTIAKD